MDSVSTTGLMVAATEATGNRINFMAEACTPGRMAGHTRETTRKTRSKVGEPTSGPMARSMRASGIMENSMVKENSLTLRTRAELDFGRWVSAKSGYHPKSRRSSRRAC